MSGKSGQSSTSVTRGTTQISVNNASAANATANNARIIGITVLATMLRYATYIQPPSIRAREEHIVPTIVNLLRDNVKMDIRLKRRLSAALGEMIFYISAQEEETTSTNSGDSLPSTLIGL